MKLKQLVLKVLTRKKWLMGAGLLAFPLIVTASSATWVHLTPSYVKDGSVSLQDSNGSAISYSRNNTSLQLDQRRARDVRVVVVQVQAHDPWSLDWSNNTVR